MQAEWYPQILDMMRPGGPSELAWNLKNGHRMR